MKSKFIFTVLIFALMNLSVYAQKNQIGITEFQVITGKWTGKLIYLDYQSNQPYEMPADLEISQINKSGEFKFLNSYPNEPSANSTDTLSIKDDGTKIDNELVILKQHLSDGKLKIVTEILGKDGNDNKPAIMRHTYLIGKQTLEIKKEVQFAGTSDWILRHTFSYSR